MMTNDIHVCAFPKSGVTYFGLLLGKGESRTVDDITPELVDVINTRAQPVYELAKSRLA